jgi:hypothetical protein
LLSFKIRHIVIAELLREPVAGTETDVATGKAPQLAVSSRQGHKTLTGATTEIVTGVGVIGVI